MMMERWLEVDPVKISSEKRETPELQPAARPPTTRIAALRDRTRRLCRIDPFHMTLTHVPELDAHD